MITVSIFPAPKSICICGHEGDGEMSPHGGLIGHGACAVRGCGCAKFTWSQWTPAYQAVINRQHKLKTKQR